MKVFITGASGWIGSAVVAELIGAGHQVIGLARSDRAATALTAAGAQVARGTLDDLDVLRQTAAASDGVINLAFNHDIAFSGGFQEATNGERLAVEAISEALVGTDRPFVLAAGLLGMLPGHMATERDGHGNQQRAGLFSMNEGGWTRLDTAEFALSLATRGVRTSIIRLSPTNHGDGDNGFMTSLIGIARQKGSAGYIGDGAQRWPAVHRLDSAHLFCLALEKATAGTTLHAVADEGVEIRDIAEVIGKHLEIPVVSIAPEQAGAHFGWMAPLLQIDQPASSALTREWMGWEPAQPGLLADLDLGHYFKPAK